MKYKVNLDSLDRVYNSVSKQSEEWIGELEKVTKKAEVLLGTRNMFGAAADSIKNYTETVHKTLLQLLSQLISLHSYNCLLYKVDYQNNIDSGLHFKIRSSELRDYKTRIESTNKKAIEIDDGVTYVLNGIKDIMVISRADISAVDWQHTQVATYLEDLDNKIINLENNHHNNDFVNTADMLQSLKNFIVELLDKDRSYRTNFTMEKLASSDAFHHLYGSMVNVLKEYEEKADSIEAAVQFQAQHVAALEQEERESREWIQWIATGVAIVGSVALIVVTAGGATPLVCAAVGAGAGVLTAASKGFADNYVKTGSLTEGMDWSEFGKNCLIGGATGAVTGYLGANAIGSVIKQPIQNAALSAATSIASESVEGLIDISWDVGEAIVQGKPGNEILSIFDENTNEMLREITVGGATGFVSGYISGSFDVSTDDKGFWRKTGENVLEESAKAITENSIETVWDIGDAVLDPNSSDNFITILEREGKEFLVETGGDIAKGVVTSAISSGVDVYKDGHKNNNTSNFKKVANEFVASATGETAGSFIDGVTKQSIEKTMGDRESIDFKEIWKEDMESGHGIVKGAVEDAAKEGAKLHYEDKQTQIDLGRKDYNKDGKVDVVVFDKYAVLKEDYDAARSVAGKGAYKDQTAQDILGLPKKTAISEKRVVQKTVSIEDLEKSTYKGRKKTNVTRYNIKK